MDLQTIDALADLFRVGIEKSDDTEAALLEAAIAKQGPGEVADADQRHRPFAVHAERPADGGDQFVGGIADAGMAEVAKRRQVLAHLRVGDAERLTELAAGDLGG